MKFRFNADRLCAVTNDSHDTPKDGTTREVTGLGSPHTYRRINELLNDVEKIIWFKYGTVEGNIQYERFFSNSYHEKNK